MDPKPLYDLLTKPGGLSLIGGTIGLAIGYDFSDGVMFSECIPLVFKPCPPPSLINPFWFGVVGALPGSIKLLFEMFRD